MTAAREKGACDGAGVPHGLVLLAVGFLGTGSLEAGGDSVFKPDSMLSSKKEIASFGRLSMIECVVLL